MKKGLFALYRQRIFYALTSPLFYACALVLDFFCAGTYFLFGNFFSGSSGTSLYPFFASVPYVSVIVIPVLCLNSFSSYEKMLPFSKAELESVKILSVLTEFFLILLPLVFVPVSVNMFGYVEKAEVFTGFIFIMLYALVSVSLCFLIQSLAGQKGLSFLVSVVILSLFNFSHFLASALSSSSFAARILKMFSFSWHFDSARKGIFDSRDFVFFVSFSALFVCLDVFSDSLKAGKKFSRKQKTGNFLALLVIVLAFLDGQRFYFRTDLTRQKKYSVSGYTKNLLKESGDSLTITYYRSQRLQNLYPAVNDIQEILNEYAQDRNVSLEVHDPEKQGMTGNLLDYGVFPRQLQHSEGGKVEYLNVYSSVVLEKSGKVEVVPFILSSENLEFQVTEKIYRLMTGSPRYVNIISGSGEDIRENYSYLSEFLSSQGFSVNILDGTSGAAREIRECSEYGNLLLVLGSKNFTDEDIQEIETYLEKGKRVFFAVSPYEKDIEETWRITKNENLRLLDFIESFGIKFSGNIVSDISSQRILMQDENSISQYINYPLWVSVLPQKNAKEGMTLFWPVSLELLSENASPLVMSSRLSSEKKPSEDSPENLFVTNPFMVAEEGFSSSGEKKEFALAAEYSGESYGFYNPGIFEDVRFYVVSDQYFLNSLMLGYIGGNYGDFRNLDFLADALLKLGGDEELSALYEKGISGRSGFFKTPDEESFLGAQKASLALNFLLAPVLLVILCGTMLTIRRERMKEPVKNLKNRNP